MRGDIPDSMSDTPNALIIDLLEWLASGPKPYADVMDAWRTSCPRLTIWEDAVEQGLVQRRRNEDRDLLVALTEAGWTTLRQARPVGAIDGRHDATHVSRSRA